VDAEIIGIEQEAVDPVLGDNLKEVVLGHADAHASPYERDTNVFSQGEFRVNTIGVFAHDIVILLDPAEIVENIHDAYGHPHFRDKAYSLLMSGPSGSADIAGTTVHPAQGVTTLTVVFWPRA
jgi:L-lactate dehydrogenase complex protein LldG